MNVLPFPVRTKPQHAIVEVAWITQLLHAAGVAAFVYADFTASDQMLELAKKCMHTQEGRCDVPVEWQHKLAKYLDTSHPEHAADTGKFYTLIYSSQ